MHLTQEHICREDETMAKLIKNFAEVEPEKGKKVLLNLRHVDVKFNVRGRILNAIRDISLKIYDGESIAIVGESGSGKSVLTKTFAGMLDSNGFISHGKIIFNDEELSKTQLKPSKINNIFGKIVFNCLEKNTHLANAREERDALVAIEDDLHSRISLPEEQEEAFLKKKKELSDSIVDINNAIQVLDGRNKEDAEKIRELKERMGSNKVELKNLVKEHKNKIKELKKKTYTDVSYMADYNKKHLEAKANFNKAVAASKEKGLDQETISLNERLADEAILSIGRYPIHSKIVFTFKLCRNFKRALLNHKDLTNSKQLDKVYSGVTFRVDLEEKLPDGTLKGHTIVDCAQVKFTKDWQKIRGCKIATVFQDPMTSLNPIITIGKQISMIIMKHQKCDAYEAKQRAIEMMEKVGIPDAKYRYDDYPFQYSGGMRQRIVIAIALSCQPKILICDEPTTALDVTIQAQIIRLIKDLGKELGFTTVYITHDLGVVANVAERVAVLYGGQIVEVGKVEDIFYEPAHPYTWALLSSLPQLTDRGQELFSISGTPPSLYNKIIGDAFAPRNEYALAIDFVKEPPMFEINDHHWAKTWLLDDRAPKIEKPEIIRNLHEKMCKIYEKEID